MAKGTKKQNKVKFGLKNVHYAKILGWSESTTTGEKLPNYAPPVPIPGAVSLSIDANGESENFYADNTVYYVINNNSGYEGDLEIALMETIFAVDILGEKIDNNGLQVENTNAELSEFALFWEFDGDQNHIRHVAYRCAASRPGINGNTTEDSKTPETDTISLKMLSLPNGIVKAKTTVATDETVYKEWFKSVHMPEFTEGNETVTASEQS
ncbi:MAG: phage tail protein [Oscillospiraceae bacterium]|nr:phage tail protein [Oscillospiraceae bacterium]